MLVLCGAQPCSFMRGSGCRLLCGAAGGIQSSKSGLHVADRRWGVRWPHGRVAARAHEDAPVAAAECTYTAADQRCGQRRRTPPRAGVPHAWLSGSACPPRRGHTRPPSTLTAHRYPSRRRMRPCMERRESPQQPHGQPGGPAPPVLQSRVLQGRGPPARGRVLS